MELIKMILEWGEDNFIKIIFIILCAISTIMSFIVNVII